MAYTTVASVSTGLPFNFERGSAKKLLEDGYIDVAGTFDKTSFVEFFIERTADFIDSYLAAVGTPPFAQSGLLERINRILATYEIEQYIVSSQQDRTINISIYALQKDAMKWLDGILKGDIDITLENEAADQGTVRLIEACSDVISDCALEENVLFGSTNPMESDCCE